MDTMAFRLPEGISARPRAATRYLAGGRRPWRITIVLQGARGMGVIRGEDRILGHRPAHERSPASGCIWGVSMVLAGSALVTDLQTRATAELHPGGWFLYAGRPTSCLALHPGPGFAEMAFSTDAELGGHLSTLGLWPQSWHMQSVPDPGMLNAGMDLHRALLDPAVPDSGLIRRLVCMLDMLRTSQADGPEQGFRERACRILAQHPQPGYTIADAAGALGMPEQVFRKRFAREVGISPGRWQQRRRMERASGMLASMTVAAVAAQLGYSDVAAFSRQFRQLTGQSPQQMQRMAGLRRDPRSDG